MYLFCVVCKNQARFSCRCKSSFYCETHEKLIKGSQDAVSMSQ